MFKPTEPDFNVDPPGIEWVDDKMSSGSKSKICSVLYDIFMKYLIACGIGINLIGVVFLIEYFCTR